MMALVRGVMAQVPERLAEPQDRVLDHGVAEAMTSRIAGAGTLGARDADGVRLGSRRVNHTSIARASPGSPRITNVARQPKAWLSQS
jgi:hypothetical protein